MEIGSKLIIKKIEPQITQDGKEFLSVVLLEKVYNMKRPYANKWETAQYKAQLFTDLPVEEAKFDLDISKDKYSTKNISNPERSIIRITDFKFEKVTAWKGQVQLKTDLNQPIMNDKFYITGCEFDKVGWKSNERIIREQKEKIEEQKKLIREQKNEIKKLQDALCNANTDLSRSNGSKTEETKEVDNLLGKEEKAVKNEMSDLFEFGEI